MTGPQYTNVTWIYTWFPALWMCYSKVYVCNRSCIFIKHFPSFEAHFKNWGLPRHQTTPVSGHQRCIGRTRHFLLPLGHAPVDCLWELIVPAATSCFQDGIYGSLPWIRGLDVGLPSGRTYTIHGTWYCSPLVCSFNTFVRDFSQR